MKISEHFEKHGYEWLLIHHYLSAHDLRLLCEGIVRDSSEASVKLQDLVTEHLIPSEDHFGTWGIELKPVSGYLNSYLQRFVQCLVWQGDALPGLHGREGPLEEVARAQRIEHALELSFADLSSPILQEDTENVPSVLIDHVLKMRELSHLSGDRSTVPDVKPPLLNDGSPFDALIAKHYGDLCADQNMWEAAQSYYGLAQQNLRACIGSEWRMLSATAALLIAQAKAACTAMLEGPEPAVGLLEVASRQSAETRFLAVKNVTPDLMSAKSSADPLSVLHDRRGSFVFAPQLAENPHLLRALENWKRKRFVDAHRWFWAVLRRQIAFGSTQQRNETKAYYGHSLIDAAAHELARSRKNEGDFMLGLRLLVDSRDYGYVEKMEWQGEVVASYVDEPHVAKLIELSQLDFAKTEVQERCLVIAVIFQAWLLLIPRQRSTAATKMLEQLASFALDFQREFFKHENVGGFALQAIKTVGSKRPEFRSLCPSKIAEVALNSMERSNPLEIGDAIEIVELFANSFDPQSLERIISRVLDLTEQIPAGEGQWPILRPTFHLLAESHSAKRFASNDHLSSRILHELVRLTFGSESEYPYAMHLLAYFTPEEVRRHVEHNKLRTLVDSVKETASRTNSSTAVGAMQALFLAPEVVGAEGLMAGLEALKSALTIPEGKRASISLSEACYVLVQLSKNSGVIIEMLKDGANGAGELLDTVANRICSVWAAAAVRPAVFARFALPFPTEPEDTVVHNWSYASLTFAASYGHSDKIYDAIAEARKNPLLGRGIDTGKAAFLAGNNLAEQWLKNHDFGDSAEAYYFALGAQLLLTKQWDDEKRKAAISQLLDLTLLHGPDGQDAAVMLEASSLGIKASDGNAVEQYRERLLAKRSLRNSLMALLESVRKLK